jgi:hypothetical protein
MKPRMYDFATVAKIMKLRKERHELLWSSNANDIRKHKAISGELFQLTGNEIYLRF